MRWRKLMERTGPGLPDAPPRRLPGTTFPLIARTIAAGWRL